MDLEAHRLSIALFNQFMTTDEPFTIGVEEEYQIVHPATRGLRSRAQLILPEAQAALGNQVTPHSARFLQMGVA